jgi:hypothetical protein
MVGRADTAYHILLRRLHDVRPACGVDYDGVSTAINGWAHRWLGSSDELREFEVQPVRWTLIEPTIPMTTKLRRKNAPLAVLEEV